MGEDRELLAQRELDDGLVLAAPEQSEDAPKDRDRESRYGPHRSRILLESRPRREPESGLTLRLPFNDECGHRREKPEQNQLGRILITHTSRISDESQNSTL
jgi:hypothetical protein